MLIPECPCWSRSEWQQAHVIGCCRCRCTSCLARQGDLARERDTGGCYVCTMCGTRVVPEDIGTFIAARHPRAAPRQLPVCDRCWHIDLGAIWAAGMAA